MPAPDDPPRLSDDECVALFRRLFPQGLSGADVFTALAPRRFRPPSPPHHAWKPEGLHRD